MKKHFVLLIAVLLSGNAPSAFKSQYIIPYGAITVCTSDIDNDLDMDIITGHNVGWGYTNKSISVLENIDKGVFSVKDTSKSFCGYQKNIFAIRVDNDLFPDLVVFYSDLTYGTQRYIRVYYNEGGNFNNYSDFNLNSDATFSHINHGKINSDDFDDIVVASNNDHFWGVLYNDGNGGFTSPEYYNVQGSHPTDISCGDLNGDGREDVIVAGAKLEAYYSSDTGFVLDSIGYQQGLVQITDIDGDTDNDLVCLSGLPTTIVTVIENIGNDNFITHEPMSYNPYCWRFITSDLNNDSLPDLITSSVDNGVYLLYNDGNYQFSNPVFISVPLNGYDFVNACSADLDNNGFNDLVITQTNVHFINVLFNDGNGNFVENPITDIYKPPACKDISVICYPNPFVENISIKFKNPEPGIIKLSVYDICGNLVINLPEKRTDDIAGTYFWNGLNKLNQEIKPGIYFVKITFNIHQHHIIKIIKK